MEKFKIDSEKLLRFSTAIGQGTGDIADMRSADQKHACELLARLTVLQQLAPGFLDEMFDIWIPHFIKQHNKLTIEKEADKRFDAAGFGKQWRAAVAAGRSPNKKDSLLRQVELYMAATGANQNEAINALAEHTQRDPESIRRIVTRSKGRFKP